MHSRAAVLLAFAPWLAGCHDWDSLSKDFQASGSGGSGSGASGSGASGGSGDGGAGGAGGSAPYCASLGDSPILCNDFDGVGPLVDWESTTEPPGGTIEVDDTFARSAPRSLRTTIPVDGDFLPAFLQRIVALPADGAVLGFALRVHAAGTDPLLVAALQDYSPDCAVGVEVIGAGARVVQWGASGNTESAFVALAEEPAWSRVELHFDRSADPATVRLDVDGGTSAVLDADRCADAPYIQVGALYAPPSENGWDLSIDDLLLRAP